MAGSETRADRWRLLLSTAKYMKPEQLLGIAERKLRHAVVPSIPVDFDARYERRVPPNLSCDGEPLRSNTRKLRSSLTEGERTRYREQCELALDGTIRFLNRSIRFDDPAEVDWDHEALEEYPRLWRVKLHGFVPLSWAVRGYDDPASELDALFRSWIRDWTATHSLGGESYLRGSWTPYAVSLRIQHWVRYLAWRSYRDDLPAFPELRRAIYKNALFLRNNVETDVGGNHLAENGAALVVAGSLFPDRGGSWLDAGVEVLRKAARTQFLDDGGHFERSPMYHLLVLENYLTAIDVLDTVGYPVPAEVRRTAREAVRFVANIRSPDGEIPLLNDSVFGQALSTPATLAYAERVGVDADMDTSRPRAEGASLPASGYYWLGSGPDRLLVDGGPPGPPHLPGHAHNDHLQVLLWLDGQRVITDTGVFHYAPDERREAARGVEGHNTVQVDDAEPIEIGGRYLMGRRTRPDVTFEVDERGAAFDGRYVVPSGLGRAYVHRRRVLHRPTWWLIWDDVELAEPATVHSRLHLAPGASVDRSADDGEWTGSDGAGGDWSDGEPLRIEAGGATCWLHPLNADGLDASTTDYYPEFGVAEPRQTLDLLARRTDATSYGFLLTGERRDKVVLDRSGGWLDGLWLDGEREPVPDAIRSPVTDKDLSEKIVSGCFSLVNRGKRHLYVGNPVKGDYGRDTDAERGSVSGRRREAKR